MGQPELAAALRRSGEEQARKIWNEVERQATAEAEENDKQRTALRRTARSRRRAQLGELVAAERQAAGERLRLERSLLQQLLTEQALLLAQQQLGALLEALPRAELFRACVAELPDAPWEELLVAPADAETARQRFSGARILSDDETAGGVLGRTDGGRIEIDNRLETRLRRAWPALQTRLLLQLRADFEATDADA